MTEEWLDNSLDPIQKLERLESENQMLKFQINALRDFAQRVDRNLEDPKLYQIMLDEFLIHCKADRVVILVQDEIKSTWIAHIHSCDPAVKAVKVPYFIDNCELSYLDFLKETVESGQTHSIQWNEAVRVHEEIYVQRCMATPFQVEGEFGNWLICLQWVTPSLNWENQVRPMFENMAQYSRVIVDQRQMRFQIEELQNQEQTFLDCMPSALVGLDLLGNITLWSGKSEEYLGLRMDEVIGVPFGELFPELKVIEDKVPELINGGEPIWLKDLEYDGLKFKGLMYGLVEMGRGEIAVRLDVDIEKF